MIVRQGVSDGAVRAAVGLWCAALCAVVAASFVERLGLDRERSVMVWLACGAVSAWPFIRDIAGGSFRAWAGRWIVAALVITVLLHLER